MTSASINNLLTFGKIIAIALIALVLFFGFKYYTLSNLVEEQENIINQQKSELTIKSMEIDNLTESINTQNEKLNMFKAQSEHYSKEIEKLNNMIEQELADSIEFEKAPDGTCEESIQWLKQKQHSVSF